MEKIMKYSFFKELSLRRMLFLALVFGFLINNSEGGCRKCCRVGGKSKGKSNGKYEGRKPNKKITLKFTIDGGKAGKVKINENNENSEIDNPVQESGRNGGDIWLFRVDDEDLGIKLFNKDIEIEIKDKDKLPGTYLISCVQMAEKYKGGGYYILYSSNCQSKLDNEYVYGLFDCYSGLENNAFQRNITVMKLVACGSIVTNMKCMFYNCRSLEKVKFGNNFNTSEVVDMNHMFRGCSSLTKLDLNNFDTSKVTDMSYMFFGCSSLEEIKFEDSFSTNNVKSMISMFNECSSLKELDLSKFDTSKVTNMNFMFYKCKNLKEIKFGNNFNTSKVTNMEGMFYECRSLTNLNLSNFDTSKVTNMKGMFYECRSLTNLNLSNFDISKVTNMKDMFEGCTNYLKDKLKKIDSFKGYFGI